MNQGNNLANLNAAAQGIAAARRQLVNLRRSQANLQHARDRNWVSERNKTKVKELEIQFLNRVLRDCRNNRGAGFNWTIPQPNGQPAIVRRNRRFARLGALVVRRFYRHCRLPNDDDKLDIVRMFIEELTEGLDLNDNEQATIYAG